jgi:hypothetical protein
VSNSKGQSSRGSSEIQTKAMKYAWKAKVETFCATKLFGNAGRVARSTLQHSTSFSFFCLAGAWLSGMPWQVGVAIISPDLSRAASAQWLETASHAKAASTTIGARNAALARKIFNTSFSHPVRDDVQHLIDALLPRASLYDLAARHPFSYPNVAKCAR